MDDYLQELSYLQRSPGLFVISHTLIAFALILLYHFKTLESIPKIVSSTEFPAREF